MKCFFTLILIATVISVSAQVNNPVPLYEVDNEIESRSISFENPTGAPGAGGTAVNSQIGKGRKGAPNKLIEPTETVVLCDIQEKGTIRHIWMTGEWINFPWLKVRNMTRSKLLRSIVIRAYWDDQQHPSIECPLGDFMGLAHAKIVPFQNSVHSIGENGALNIWLPMPFNKNARITLTNESDVSFTLFYQIDYTINDQHQDNVGRLHVNFSRENPTTPKVDFEILPKREGKGRFIGAVLGIRTLHPGWWGEGEIKFYMDGDTEYPTICGTGSEDWIALSYEMQQTPYQYHGCNLRFISDSTTMALDLKTNQMKEMNREYITMYRWHLPDPIYWKKDCRVTIQQIGCCYYERKDDWSTATFWYEPVPSAPLPEMPDMQARTKDLEEVLR